MPFPLPFVAGGVGGVAVASGTWGISTNGGTCGLLPLPLPLAGPFPLVGPLPLPFPAGAKASESGAVGGATASVGGATASESASSSTLAAQSDTDISDSEPLETEPVAIAAMGEFVDDAPWASTGEVGVVNLELVSTATA